MKFYNLFLNHKYLEKLTTAVCSSVDTFGSLGKTANITVTSPDNRKAPTPAYLGKYIVQCIKNYSGSNLCIIFLLIHALFIPCLRAGRVGVFSNFEIEM